MKAKENLRYKEILWEGAWRHVCNLDRNSRKNQTVCEQRLEIGQLKLNKSILHKPIQHSSTLNNNLIMVVSGTFSADVVENNSMSWMDIPVTLLINGLMFGLFIFAKQYRSEEPLEVTAAPAAAYNTSAL